MSAATLVQRQAANAAPSNTTWAAVIEEISEIDGVRTVEVDLATGKVVVLSDRPLIVDAVSAAVTEAGYTLVS